MTYTTQPTRRKAMSSSRILTMVLTGLLLVTLQSSTVHAQWTTGTNINNTNTGNVGIGTASPTEKLEVNGTVKSSGLTITGAPAEPANVNALYLGMSGTTATIDAVNQNVDFRDLVISNKTFQVKSWNGSGLVTGLYQNNAGNVGVGTATPNKSSVSRALTVNGSTDAIYELAIGDTRKGNMYHDGTNLSVYNNANGPLTLGTNNNERLRIDASGNVGIGTTSPGALVHVRKDQSVVTRLLVENASAGAAAYADLQVKNDLGHAAQFGLYSSTTSTAGALASGNAFTYTTSPAMVIMANNAGGVIKFATGGPDERARIDASGNVGIGTSSPSSKLHVVGDGRFTGNLTVDGNIAAKYQDMAEWVESSQELAAGTVVVLDQTKSNQVIASSVSYDTRVAGVISLQPGIALGEDGAGKVLVATTGRVRIKVDASRGSIRVGDLLVTSDIAGVAMKSHPIDVGGVQIHRPGTLIGKALEPFEKGTGEILVLLSLQ